MSTEALEQSASEFPAFEEEGYETHVSAYAEAKRKETISQLQMGAIVASLEKRYAEGVLEKFAGDVGDAPSTLSNHGWVYRRLERVENDARARILSYLLDGHLSYSHLRRAAGLKSDEQFAEVLEKAHDQSWRVKDVGDAVAVRRGLQAPPKTVPEPPEAIPQQHDAPPPIPDRALPAIGEEVLEGEVVEDDGPLLRVAVSTEGYQPADEYYVIEVPLSRRVDTRVELVAAAIAELKTLLESPASAG